VQKYEKREDLLRGRYSTKTEEEEAREETKTGGRETSVGAVRGPTRTWGMAE